MSIRHGFESRGLEGTPRCGSAYRSVRSDIPTLDTRLPTSLPLTREVGQKNLSV
jgi:hypothetical protein